MFVSEKAKHLFAEAQSLSPESRLQFVTDACGENRELFRELSSLLHAADSSAAFFDQLASQIGLSALAENDDAEHHGKIVGQWRLLDCIGRGGMGSVYRAERADSDFEKTAAVKLLPLGMDSDRARARFLAERQILARLVHDNIARLLDGGVSDDGVPFFVMDLVDGLPIDEYCDSNALSINARLQLLLEVASAVQYAHRSLVVHRDLKPNNVLVEGNGRTRLLDFGVAKVLDPAENDAAVTHYAQRPMTPVFASPEMLRGDPVDVTTDVYSLGVMMFLLVTNRLPITYDGLNSADTIMRAETMQPPLASSLVAGLSSDLDAIIAKTLAKLPAERYSSMDDLSNDIRNFLAGRPVVAKPLTPWYRLGKFVRRNKAVLSGATVAVAGLFALAITAMLQYVEAGRQRDVAIAEQQRVQASNEFYGLLLEEMGQKSFTSVELLDRGTELLRKQYGVEEAFMGQVLYDVSNRYGNLGENTEQLQLLQQAEVLARKYDDANLLATVLCRIARVGGVVDSETQYDYAIEGTELYARTRFPSVEASISCLRTKAQFAEREGNVEEATDHLHAAIAILDAHPASASSLRGPVLGHLSNISFKAKRIEETLAYLDDILELLDNTGRGSSMGYLQVASNKAVTLQSAGRLPESLRAWSDIVSKLRASGYEQRGAASFLGKYGATLAAVGKMQEAEAIHREGIVAADSAGDLESGASNRIGLGRVYLASKEYSRALDSLDAAQELLSKDEDTYQVLYPTVAVLRVKVFRTMGDLERALPAVEDLLVDVGYPDAQRAQGLLSALIEAAAVHQALGNFGHAEELVDDLILRLSRNAVGDPTRNLHVVRAHVHRAEIRTSRGNTNGAIEDLDLAIPVLAEVLGNEHEETLAARDLLLQNHSSPFPQK